MHTMTLNTPAPTSLRAFALISLVFHGIVLGGWWTAPWITGRTNDVLSVTLISEHASPPARTGEQLIRAPSRYAGAVDEQSAVARSPNQRSDRDTKLAANPAQTNIRLIRDETNSSRNTPPISVREAQNPASSSTRTSATENEREQAEAQIKTRLNTDLARYFDYPYVARLRGWEGTVLLAFNIEANGRLEGIHVARSSGYAVLDDSALSALRKVERLVETTAWLQNRELNMQIPVIYRLRCADTPQCRDNP